MASNPPLEVRAEGVTLARPRWDVRLGHWILSVLVRHLGQGEVPPFLYRVID